MKQLTCRGVLVVKYSEDMMSTNSIHNYWTKYSRGCFEVLFACYGRWTKNENFDRSVLFPISFSENKIGRPAENSKKCISIAKI